METPANEKQPEPEPRKVTPEEIAEGRIAEALRERDSHLNLNGLGLTALPKSIGRLTQLETLWINNNRLRSLPEAILQLRNLRRIDARENEFVEFPEVLRFLTQIHAIHVDACGLSTLPNWLGELRNLCVLVISDNDLRTLPASIGDLQQLQKLDAAYNQLTALPESLWRLSKLSDLYLQGNDQLGIPREVLGRRRLEVGMGSYAAASPQEILGYYLHICGAARPLNEAKLILIGRGEVGKTCLVNRLVRDKFVDTSKTQGIRIEQWPLKLGKDKVRLHVWDFGGQEIMHATPSFSSPSAASTCWCWPEGRAGRMRMRSIGCSSSRASAGIRR